MTYRVIDVSKWQGYIDFKQVKATGVFGVIIKAGGSDNGFYTDPKFEENYKNATAAGLHVGCYYFVGPKCTSATAGKNDAAKFKKIIKGKVFSLPVYMDFEAPPATNKAGNTAAVISFCDTMEKAGYFCGVYASEISGFKDRLNNQELRRFAFWVAKYGQYKPQSVPCPMWQYSSHGRVNGVYGDVDMNLLYVNYPAIIKNKHLNGW